MEPVSTQYRASSKADKRSGNAGKIHLTVDPHGLPIEFEITGGQVNDSVQAPSLFATLALAETISADKGYDSEKLRKQIEEQGAMTVIPRKRNSLKGNADLDRGLYKNRHLVENVFARLKRYRSVATRSISYAGIRQFGCSGLCCSLIIHVKRQQA
jgi:transposase